MDEHTVLNKININVAVTQIKGSIHTYTAFAQTQELSNVKKDRAVVNFHSYVFARLLHS